MSLAEAVKRLAASAPGAQQQVQMQAVQAPTAYSVYIPTRPSVALPAEAKDVYTYIAKALNMPESQVNAVCTSSEPAKQWCEYFYWLLQGSSPPMPSAPLPPGMEDLALRVARATGNRDLMKVVERRSEEIGKAILEAIERLRKSAREAAMRLAEGKVKESMSRMEEVVRAVNALASRLPKQAVAAEVAETIVSVLGERFKAPEDAVAQAKASAIRTLVASTPETAREAAQSLVEALRRAFIPQIGQISAQQMAVKAQEVSARQPVQPSGQITAAGLPTMIKKLGSPQP